jgi:cytochrome P450
MDAFTTPIPNAVISRITGVPPGEDEARFRALAQSIVRAFFPFASAEAAAEGERALRAMSEWVRELAAQRRRDLRDDLISDLIRGQAENDLADDDVVILISVLIGAGSETTNLAGALMARTLLEQPEALARVRADRSLVPQAVGEVLRFAFGGPAGILRYAVRDFELRGRTIRKGQMIMLSLGGANRDPAVFPDPDRFDLDRDTRESLVFGNGPHFCLGANLARGELAGMLEALLDIAPPGSRVREDLVRMTSTGLLGQPANLPVEISAA